MQRLVDKGNKVPTPSLHDQKTATRASLGSAIQTLKHSKSAIRGRFHNRSVIRRFCKIRESVQFFNKICESVSILGQIRRSASLFTPPPPPSDRDRCAVAGIAQIAEVWFPYNRWYRWVNFSAILAISAIPARIRITALKLIRWVRIQLKYCTRPPPSFYYFAILYIFTQSSILITFNL